MTSTLVQNELTEVGVRTKVLPLRLLPAHPTVAQSRRLTRNRGGICVLWTFIADVSR